MSKILVAEDSIIVNQHIKFTLEKGGHSVISAYTGKEAISLAKENQPDLILMDIMMETSSDGLDAAIIIKQTLDIPIIFLTALTDDPTIEKAKYSLPYGYVIKPFNEAELLSNIDVAIYKAEAERKIKENSELFQIIIKSINQAIILIDDKQKIKYTNEVSEKILDKKFDALIDQSLFENLQITKGNTNFEYPDLQKISLEDEFSIGNLDRIFGDFKQIEVSLDTNHDLLVFNDITDRVRAREAKENLKNQQVSSLIQGQEKERERIARDLHDGVGQIANLVKLEAKKKDSKKEDLIDLIDLFLDEMRKATEGLLPSRLKDFPLEVSIRKMIEQANAHSTINFVYHSEDIPEIAMNRKINLYRIVQECLSNILKHSNATQATIQLFGFEHFIQLTFEDDGKGFNVDTKRNATHHGIQNIIFRAEVLNANWDIESRPGEGTFISITIPLEEK